MESSDECPVTPVCQRRDHQPIAVAKVLESVLIIIISLNYIDLSVHHLHQQLDVIVSLSLCEVVSELGDPREFCDGLTVLFKEMLDDVFCVDINYNKRTECDSLEVG
jgi:uncharacterized protein YjfI (DUF2170 family)